MDSKKGGFPPPFFLAQKQEKKLKKVYTGFYLSYPSIRPELKNQKKLLPKTLSYPSLVSIIVKFGRIGTDLDRLDRCFHMLLVQVFRSGRIANFSTSIWPIRPNYLSKGYKMTHFAENQTYTLTGSDLYRAEKIGSIWLMVDINKTISTNNETRFGYLLKEGKYYKFEAYNHPGGRKWKTTPAYIGEFRPCQTVTETIDLSEEF